MRDSFALDADAEGGSMRRFRLGFYGRVGGLPRTTVVFANVGFADAVISVLGWPF